ncbi:MAG: hypothetical protein AAGA67_05635, partial [Cyanobacteria bacterium P01_F01_bin.153]
QNADVTLRLAHHRDLDGIVDQAMETPSDMGLVGAQESLFGKETDNRNRSKCKVIATSCLNEKGSTNQGS